MSGPSPIGNAALDLASPSGVTVQFSGAWVQGSAVTPPQQLIAKLAETGKPDRLIFVARDLESWDSRLPTYLLKIIDYCQQQNIPVETGALPEGIQGLLRLARAVPERAGARKTGERTPMLATIGKAIIGVAKDATGLVAFIGESMLAGAALFRGRARLRPLDLVLCVQESGPGALAIVTLISVLVGLILAFVGAVQLAMFGAQIYIADLVGLGTVREMGALMTAIIMAGRTGAAYAAQLGTMNVNSEIDALKTMGISPMEFLVLPRMLALILMMPLLCLYADLMGIFGGALVTVSAFDVSLLQYYNETRHAVHLADLGIGLFKSLVFAALIAVAGCRRGMQCGHSAAAVGDAATAAVVDSIVYLVVADSVITLICNRLGI